MNQTTIFRFLILASLALAVLGTFLDLVVPGLLPAGLEAAYEADEEPALSLVLLLAAVSLILLVGGIVATVGLLLFKPWSRAAALWLTVLSLVIYPFLGPFLQSGWAFMLYEVAMMFWGAALAMAYFSELRPRFDRQSH
jgi:urea transporter